MMSDRSRLLSQFVKPHPQTRQALILLALLTATLYLPSLFNGFVWDDHFVVLTNDFVHSWKNIPLVFSRQYLTRASDMSLSGVKTIGSGELSYRPVVTLSYFLDWSIWQDNPFGYHLHNLVYHVFNTLLVFVLVFILIRRRWVAFGSALFFAWHPIHVEAVNAIGNREDLQFFFFYMAALLCHIQGHARANGQRRAWVLGSVCLFFLALFAKEMAVTLPVVFLLYDSLYRRGGRPSGRGFRPGRRYAAYLLVLGFYIYIRFFVIFMPCDPRDLWLGNNFYTHLIIIFKIIGVYLFWLAVPAGWHHILPEDTSFAAYSFWEMPVVLAFLAVAGLLVAAVRLRHRMPALTFGVAWFFITIGPVLNFYPQQNFAALRYLYLPSVGFSLALGAGLQGVIRSRWLASSGTGRGIAAAAGILVLSGFAMGTLRGIAIWKDDMTFGRHLAAHYPDIARIRCVLGTYYWDRGQESKALEEIEATLALDPRYGKAYLCRGIISFKKGDLDKAQIDLERALAYDQDLWQGYFYLGRVYAEQGFYERGIEQFQQLLQIVPRETAVYVNLGVIYLRMGEIQKARQVWEKALEIDPDNPLAERWLRRLSAQERGNP